MLPSKELGKNVRSIAVDFLSPKLLYRQKNPQRELLKKAMGALNPEHNFVVDATAGFGEDAFILACKGYDVLMIERSKVLGALLEDGLQRYSAAVSSNPKVKNVNLTLAQGDAKDILMALSHQREIDIIYLDPMFPESKKTALPRKEMEFLRTLVGKDEDANDLLMLALKLAKNRVVIKRPRLAPYLGEAKPTFSLSGNACRFDVHITKV